MRKTCEFGAIFSGGEIQAAGRWHMLQEEHDDWDIENKNVNTVNIEGTR